MRGRYDLDWRRQTKLPTIYDGTSIGKILEIESLQKYIIKMESIETDYKLKLMIEDSINRFNFEFDNPTKDVHNDDALLGRGVKGMLAKGPELRMEIIPSQSQEAAYAIRIIVYKGKKNLFNLIKLRRYIRENFDPNNNQTIMR